MCFLIWQRANVRNESKTNKVLLTLLKTNNMKAAAVRRLAKTQQTLMRCKYINRCQLKECTWIPLPPKTKRDDNFGVCAKQIKYVKFCQ